MAIFAPVERFDNGYSNGEAIRVVMTTLTPRL